MFCEFASCHRIVVSPKIVLRSSVNWDQELHESFTRDALVYHKELINGSGSGNFLKDLSTLQDRAFFCSLAHICGKTDDIFVRILS